MSLRRLKGTTALAMVVLTCATAAGAWSQPLATQSKAHRRPVAPQGVLAAAGCYGRFIAWRDELAGLMQQTGSYTPLPGDRDRFDRVEQAFVVRAKQERNLTLILRPSFKEGDFPADMRAAFRAGDKLASARFADAGYRSGQVMIVNQFGLSPADRMSKLEAAADQAFADLAAPCERQLAP